MTDLKKSDYKVLYDGRIGSGGHLERERALRKLMSCSAVWSYARSNPGGSIYQAKMNDTLVRYLVGCSHDFKSMMHPKATHKGFGPNGQALGWFEETSIPKGFKALPTEIAEENTGIGPLIISEYYNGKRRQVTDGMNVYTCTITITEEAWSAVRSMGAGIGISQIKGILGQDPILVSQKSKQQGVRCIKPEPYGWIFSTSVSNRLTDTTTDPRTTRPTSLTFDEIRSGH